jgi:hypothetical protein
LRRQTFTEPSNDGGKVKVQQVKPALSAAGQALAFIVKQTSRSHQERKIPSFKEYQIEENY